ncbi:HesA/MoeB/ThiF family protein [Microbacterium kyungheense]|uniref:Adenylyltransferase/sulfurtransferase n=1 Tax=Microbacterium kyungheense TaxID=1263636 RepID=A0A543EDQ4_9MICO|nr:HesA/MoeB/ThiF family protein [Microbacterium kyungheense]TQM19711.1 adenylyltransferase/sulfurtransferase [Microbacterium kyungheense]
MAFPPLVEPVAALSDAEQTRTARHRVLAGFGDEAQRRLAAAHIAVVGAGGLGSPVVLALAAAGIGTLTVIDDDRVEASNLQRQVMHRVADVGAPKVDSAVRIAAELSPTTVVRPLQAMLTPGTARELLAGADVVIDGTDTFPTRAAVAAACEELGVPLVWGVVQEFHAQATVFWSAPPAGTAPLRLADLYPPDAAADAPSCAQVGVLGALCLQVGSLLATEAIKLVTGVGEPLYGRVLVIDALRGRADEVPLRPAAMPAAGAAAIAAETGRGAADPVPQLSPDQALAAQRDGALLLDVREPAETAHGVVPGSVLVPLGDVLADPARIAATHVVVVCQVGMRAQRAARALRDAGVEASVLAGGIDAWTRATVPAYGALSESK